MVFVEHQPLLQRFKLLHLRGGGQRERVLRAGHGVGEVADIRQRHAEHIERRRLSVLSEFVGLQSQLQRGAVVARGGVFVRRQKISGGI